MRKFYLRYFNNFTKFTRKKRVKAGKYYKECMKYFIRNYLPELNSFTQIIYDKDDQTKALNLNGVVNFLT